ncbi:nuclear transport factor 2 family protein [Hoeflea poritis]|uniref:Nuclear transport factor 2 family protein n=1 Tax=Hoeflea poritis TaxID=2993659 RepID=A0ABT4VRX7_9HYPH|nr:nuclear transport factor 2 family protein [Hoeflea poritis]MDA4847453.1 nuclear transport factor 2 family protein [Hoeflea poritis]
MAKILFIARALLAAAMLLAAAAPGLAQSTVSAETKAELDAAQTELDKAFATSDPAMIRAMMMPDHVAVLPYLPIESSIDEEIVSLGSVNYAFTGQANRKMFALADDVVLITQEKFYDGTAHGKPLPAKVLVSAIWMKRDGKWLQRYYQETDATLHK